MSIQMLSARTFRQSYFGFVRSASHSGSILDQIWPAVFSSSSRQMSASTIGDLSPLRTNGEAELKNARALRLGFSGFPAI